MPDVEFSPTPATGSSNVASFGWQPTDPGELADFAAAVAAHGSPEYAALGYPGNPAGVLTVTFLNGSTYQYSPVPLSVFVDMLNAPSRGSFVWAVLRRGGYSYVGPL
jgi:hypothetical protein